jgi:hypothetical protein
MAKIAHSADFRHIFVIRVEGLIPKNPPFGGGASGAVIKVVNPNTIPYENNHAPLLSGGAWLIVHGICLICPAFFTFFYFFYVSVFNHIACPRHSTGGP